MAVMNQRTGTADTDAYIEKIHAIRKAAYEAKMKRLGEKNSATGTARTNGKPLGYSFKSGQDAAFASKYAYSFVGSNVIPVGKVKKNKS